MINKLLAIISSYNNINKNKTLIARHYLLDNALYKGFNDINS